VGGGSGAGVGSAVVVEIDVDVVGAGLVLLEVEELVVEVGVLLVSAGAAPSGLEHDAKVRASRKMAGMSRRMGATFWCRDRNDGYPSICALQFSVQPGEPAVKKVVPVS